MEREELRLAEALTEEQVWEADGIKVLTVSVALPQLAGKSPRAKRFNRYYRRFCRAYFTYCKQVLLPEAAASCRDAQAVSAPWSVARAELSWRVSYQSGEIVSIVCDARETISGMAPFCIRRSEVWELSAGLPMALGEFFPANVRGKKALLRFAREQTAARIETGAAYRENWRAMLRRALNVRNFYLSEDGLCFFYPLCAVAGAREGIVTFTMPYDDENGPFLPPVG